jgi:hypothetical protein
MKRKYASDWLSLGGGLSYSRELHLWFKDGRHYDERSARHNGLTGVGQQLKDLLKGMADKRIGAAR